MSKILLSMLFALMLSVSTAFAEVNYVDEANAASSNISTIFTVCPGMTYENVSDNFSGATEWSKYEHSVNTKNGDSIVDMYFVKGPLKLSDTFS